MSIRKISFVPNEYYHLYNRGTSRQCIFHDNEDYARFTVLLYISNTATSIRINSKRAKDLFTVPLPKNPLVAIGAWTLMPNHFHLLITPVVEQGVSSFMQKLSTAYAMYYNSKYKHTGVVFEGKFKSEHVQDDRYLKYLFSYIHLNCIKLIDSTWRTHGLREIPSTLSYLSSYQYSSYFDYCNAVRAEGVILNKKAFPPYFLQKGSTEKEIFDWLSFKK